MNGWSKTIRAPQAQPDSRFQRNLVDSGLVASASIGYYTQRNVGPIQLFMITTPDKAKAALKAAYAEIAALTILNISLMTNWQVLRRSSNRPTSLDAKS